MTAYDDIAGHTLVVKAGNNEVKCRRCRAASTRLQVLLSHNQDRVRQCGGSQLSLFGREDSIMEQRR